VTPVPAYWIRSEVDRVAIGEGCTFDEAAGRRVCTFIETFCCHSKGEWAGMPFVLLDWQRDWIMRLYGWRRLDGTRRFRSAYLEVAKKNGKSTLIAGLTLYHLIADSEPTAEVYVNAFDRAQASIVFDESARMIRSSPSLRKRLRVINSQKLILDPVTQSKLKANSAETASKDGVSSSCCVFDELHRQAKPDLYEIFEYAGSGRRQPLHIDITTAGFDRESICFKRHEYSEKVIAGLILDTTHLGVIYGASIKDDWESPETWFKANPSLGITIKEDTFKTDVERAKDSPSTLNNFLRLRLNIWTNASERFLARDKWDACGINILIPSELDGTPCYAGLDLASTTDIAAFVMIFEVDGKWVVKPRFWIPEDTAHERQKRDRVPYLTWAREGFLTLTPGNVIDYDVVRSDIARENENHPIIRLNCDPWNATQIANQLKEEDGIPVEFIRQGFLSMNAPTKELERLVLSGRIEHGSNPILNWMADNATADTDAAGNVKLSKQKSREKIDGMVALVDAIACITGNDDSGPSVYETRGVLTL
jgi:phage terminase large subunit-like protein